MVGVGGGAPGDPNDDPDKDLHLGDVVVSNPEGIHGKKEFYLISKSSKFIRIHRWSSTV
jgi:hypothetical protein